VNRAGTVEPGSDVVVEPRITHAVARPLRTVEPCSGEPSTVGLANSEADALVVRTEEGEHNPPRSVDIQVLDAAVAVAAAGTWL
jgi:hypothetical protein